MLPTALFVLHLMTPEGQRDHARAQAQYTELSRLDTGRSLYYPVPLGDRSVFRQTVGTLANAIVDEIQTVRGGGGAYPGEVLAGSGPGTLAVTPEPAGGGSLGAIGGLATSVRDVGRAMALAYLGRTASTQAPDLFEAWASDRDFDDPSVAAFSVRVLLSKSQLSDLQKTMEEVLGALNEAQVNPQSFFDQLQSATVTMGRNPDQVGQGPARDLASVGLMGEYLDGLPFQSRLMSLTQDDWMRMGVTEQQAFIDDASSKINLYQSFHDDVDRWLDPSTSEKGNPANAAGQDDLVYPVPLDALP